MPTQAEFDALKAQLDALKTKKVKPITMKIGEKGGLSVYGLSARFPTTLYVQQWERLLDDNQVKEIKAFIEANRSKLATKE